MVENNFLVARSQAPAWEWGFWSSSFPKNSQAGDCKIRLPKPEISSLYTSADKLENTVISAWMPISRPWTVTIRQCKCLIQATCQPAVSRPWIQGHLYVPQCCHPWTLDFGIPSEKTGLQHLCNAESRSLGTSLNLKAINVPLLLEFS